MNLYFRLIRLLFKIIWGAKKDLLAESRLVLRALPLDCDLNWHLNNARYLSFMDLGRLHLIGQANFFRNMLKQRWSPILLAAEISFIKAIKPLQRFELITRVLTWDDNYLYLEQRFEKDGKLLALAYVKGLFIGKTGKVPTSELLAASGVVNTEPPPMPEAIKYWKDLTEAKKNS
ncbi:MAG: thioesterase [Gammaproteobacteria bacterium]|jgi:acyl-CoA thioesterase FadM|nr:thioesterase [Gammaproteobacteria bacterium]